MASYSYGEQVKIVAGKYKSYGTATYLARRGKVQVSVIIDGKQKYIWASSIAKLPGSQSPTPPKSEGIHERSNANKKRIVEVDEEDYLAIERSIGDMKRALEELENKFKYLKIKNK
jgi:hypothetical protein